MDLSSTQVTDAGLRTLAPLKNLQSLNLSGTQVTDVGLKNLASVRHLHTLYLSGPQISDAGLKELAHLNNLQTLHLGGPRTKVGRLNNLTHLKGLRVLTFNMYITDEDVKNIAPLENLQTLNLHGTQITDAALKDLARLKNLQSLNLSFTQITDAGLKHLARLKNLHDLNLMESTISDRSMKYLAQLTNLQSLNLSGTKATDAGAEHLARLTNLHTLNLYGLRISDAGLKLLAPLKDNLKHLHLPYKVSDVGFIELAAFKNLQSVNLIGNRRVSNEARWKLQQILKCRIVRGERSWRPWRRFVADSGKNGQAKPPSPRQIQTWVRQLGDANFRKREEASQKLKKSGLPAIKPLLQVLDTSELEVTLRATRTLDHLFKEHDPPDKNVTTKTLFFLADQGPPAAQRWAVKVIVGRYKDGVAGAEDLVQKLYPLFPDRDQQRFLGYITSRVGQIQQTRAELTSLEKEARSRAGLENRIYRLDSEILRMEEELAGLVDALVKR